MDLFGKLKKKRILLIEDDEWIRDSLSLFFEDEGCHLITAESAEEGMEALKKQDYDIIIVDYRLPGMDGLGFLEKVKDSHPNASTLLITAYGSRDVFLKAQSMGVQGFIDKPFTVKTIEESLYRLIEKTEN